MKKILAAMLVMLAIAGITAVASAPAFACADAACRNGSSDSGGGN